MKKQTFLPYILFFALFSPACSTFDRSTESGHGLSGSRPRSSITKRSFEVVGSGASAQDEQNISQKTRLKQLENALSTKKETEQYSKALPWFRADEERTHFLALPGFEARQKWLSEQNFNYRASAVQSELKELVEAQDIAIGMPQLLVKKSWGDPEFVEVSGNPLFKNERWRYSKFVSTPDGYKPEKKIVFFEGGRVVGWEVE